MPVAMCEFGTATVPATTGRAAQHRVSYNQSTEIFDDKPRCALSDWEVD
jgi:hypothetical protein